MIGVSLLCGCRSGFNAYGTKLMKFSLCGNTPTQVMISRVYSQQGRETAWRTSRARKLAWEQAAAKPATGRAITIGRGAVGGAAVFGIGALAYYGLGLSNQSGIIEQSILWPQYVRDRVRATYLYFGSSIVVTVASAVATFKTPSLLNIASKGSLLALGATLAALMGTGLFTMSLDYSPTFDMKHVGWLAHSALVGAICAPLAFMGGAAVVRAMWYTAATIGSLSAIAMCAPSDRFLYIGGPLAAGLGLVFMSSIGTLFIPATTALGSGMASFTLYGGLLVFCGLFLYDTQRIVHRAETHPVYGSKAFDPINASISIYMDTVNIFIRMVQIFGNASGGRKK
ncbi:growth hormone-inducible transmembrane protein-like [Planococcus citri]|uniref:growth hormone-inducible transmembrane protein-like n=1 Tax=Planococcus citri TaxID=170843 RepID=UPI0031F84FCE